MKDFEYLIEDEIKAAGLQLDNIDRRTVARNAMRKWAINLAHDLEEASSLLNDIINKEYYFDNLNDDMLYEYVSRLQDCLDVLGEDSHSDEVMSLAAVDAVTAFYDGRPGRTDNEPYDDFADSEELKNYVSFCKNEMTRRME